VRIAAEPALPQSVAKDRNKVRTGSQILLRKKIAADCRLCSQNWKVARVDNLSPQLFWFIGAAQVERSALAGYSRARNRRKHRDLQRGRCYVASPAALQGPGSINKSVAHEAKYVRRTRP